MYKLDSHYNANGAGNTDGEKDDMKKLVYDLMISFMREESKKDPEYEQLFKDIILESIISDELIKHAYESDAIFGDINDHAYVDKLKNLIRSVVAELEERAIYGELNERFDKTELMYKLIPESVGKIGKDLRPYKILFTDAYNMAGLLIEKMNEFYKSQDEEFGMVAGQSKEELEEKLDYFIKSCTKAGNEIIRIERGNVIAKNDVIFFTKIWYRNKEHRHADSDE